MKRLELRVPPVAVVVIAAVSMWLVASALPALTLDVAGRTAWAVGLAAIGAGIALAGVLAFGKARTTVNPTRPDTSTAIVDSGVYRWSRNPMYLGFALALAAWALFLANPVAALIVPAFVLYLNRFQIEPEERALEARFGAAYTAYRRAVRRWL